MPIAPRKRPAPSPRLQEALTVARESNLLRGSRTEMVRGRMPKALVRQAMKVSGARTTTELVELALANLATADDHQDWLLSQRGTVSNELDLEF